MAGEKNARLCVRGFKAREKPRRSFSEGTQRRPDEAGIPRRWRCSAGAYLSPWPLKAAATSLKISLSCPWWLEVGSGLGARVLLCSVLPKIAPAASGRETAPAGSWVLANRKAGGKKKIPFWATLGSLRYRLCGFPHNHTFLFFKSVSFNEQWEGKVPFKLRTNT